MKGKKHDLSLPWQEVAAKIEEYDDQEGNDTDMSFLPDTLTRQDFEAMEVEELAILAAMRRVGAANDGVIDAESRRIIEVALDTAKKHWFPDDDTSSLKVEMNGHQFYAEFKDLLVSYASGATPVPAMAFTDIEVDMHMQRILN